MFMSVSHPGRTRPMYNVLDEKMEARAGIRLHAGMTRVWNRASMCPPNVVDLGAEVNKILGTPVGSRQFVHEKVMREWKRNADSGKPIPHVPDLQCAWQILLHARDRVATTCCARCHQPSQKSAHRSTRRACSGLWRFCWEDSLETIKPEKQDAIGDAPHEVGRIGVEVGAARCTRGVLGILG